MRTVRINFTKAARERELFEQSLTALPEEKWGSLLLPWAQEPDDVRSYAREKFIPEALCYWIFYWRLFSLNVEGTVEALSKIIYQQYKNNPARRGNPWEDVVIEWDTCLITRPNGIYAVPQTNP